MSFRLAAYGVCIEDGRVLLARHVPPKGETNWTLPGGRVEHAEDPFDAVIWEVAEETGCDAIVERLLRVDSRPCASPAGHSPPTKIVRPAARSILTCVIWPDPWRMTDGKRDDQVGKRAA